MKRWHSLMCAEFLSTHCKCVLMGPAGHRCARWSAVCSIDRWDALGGWWEAGCRDPPSCGACMGLRYIWILAESRGRGRGKTILGPLAPRNRAWICPIMYMICGVALLRVQGHVMSRSGGGAGMRNHNPFHLEKMPFIVSRPSGVRMLWVCSCLYRKCGKDAYINITKARKIDVGKLKLHASFPVGIQISWEFIRSFLESTTPTGTCTCHVWKSSLALGMWR